MSSLTHISNLILKDSGWSTERKVDPSFWINLLRKTDFSIFEALVNILENFGGLKITTLPFQEKPFLIGQQKAILLQRADPILEFLPDKSESVTLAQASLWKSVHYLKNKHLEIAPIGIFRYVYSPIFDLFVLSNGNIFGGGEYWEGNNRDNKVPGLFYLGNDIEDAINNTLEEFLAYW